MKVLIVVLIALSGLLAACDSGVHRKSANEGKAAQSAAGGGSNEGQAAGAAGR